MSALSLLVRRSLRVHARGVLGLALVIALVGGVGLAALAGARRTASAFPRYLRASDASQLSVDVFHNEDSNTDFTLATGLGLAKQARSFPGVAADSTYIGLEGMYPVVQGAYGGAEVLGSLDGRFIASDRVALRAGRLPREDRVGEVFINLSAAQEGHLAVGDTLLLEARAGFGDSDPREEPIIGRERVEVTGIGQFPDEVLTDDFDQSPRVLATPALTRKYLESTGSYFWQGLHLAPGTDIDHVIAAYQRLAGPDNAVIVKRSDEQTKAVLRTMRPVVAALGAFGIGALVAALALGALGGLRLVGTAAVDTETLRALGLRPRMAALALAAPAVVAAIIGSLGAAAVAAALSPFAPLGAVRFVEPHRGLDLDLAVLPIGAALLAVLLGAVGLIAGRAALRRREAPVVGTTAAATALGSAGAPPSVVIGAQHALGSSRGAGGSPSRPTLLACAVSVVAIVTALVFGANVHALIDNPPRYGWSPDFAVSSGGGYQPLEPAGASRVVGQLHATAMAVAGFGPVTLDGATVNGVGIIAVHGTPPITVIDGRLPTRRSEVALGAVTARHLHVVPGGSVRTETGAPLRVTGLVAAPAIGQAASAHPSLGQGAVMTLDGLSALNEGAYPAMALIDLPPGTDLRASSPRVLAAVANEMTDLPPEAANAYTDLRPGEIIGLTPATGTANLLAGVLGAAAVLALVVSLSSSVRRRARTFATLRAIGFDSGQIRSAVRWQTNAVMLVALVLGIPVGLVVARLAWAAFARDLGIATTPVIPVAVIAAGAAALILVANVAGELPARRTRSMSVRSLDESR